MGRWLKVATQSQIKYINDLVVLKTKEFKEVKELLAANEIVSADDGIVANATSVSEITNALTDLQASKMIDVLVATKTPVRATAYGSGRVKKTITALDEIKATINDWSFRGL